MYTVVGGQQLVPIAVDQLRQVGYDQRRQL